METKASLEASLAMAREKTETAEGQVQGGMVHILDGGGRRWRRERCRSCDGGDKIAGETSMYEGVAEVKDEATENGEGGGQGH